MNKDGLDYSEPAGHVADDACDVGEDVNRGDGEISDTHGCGKQLVQGRGDETEVHCVNGNLRRRELDRWYRNFPPLDRQRLAQHGREAHVQRGQQKESGAESNGGRLAEAQQLRCHIGPQ